VLARGKVVLNLTAGYDEEGITAKPFEIAASGCAMLHNWNKGLESFFEIGTEIAAFRRPREAVDQVEALLSDDARRRAMGDAARARLERDHSWDTRLGRLLTACGFTIDSFKSTASMPAAMAA
jgi:spore maturation protein CgeB